MSILRNFTGHALTALIARHCLTTTNPFEVSGVDFAGTLFVVTAAGATESKCYIVLFVCATSRAVYLDLVSSLTTEAFLMSLRRFVARRGLLHVIYSDNARIFEKASRDLEKLCHMFS